MNCIPRIAISFCLLLPCSACNAPASEVPTGTDPLRYGLHYTLRLEPAEGRVYATAEVTQDRHLLRELSFDDDPRLDGLEGDGQVARDGDRWVWQPPSGGGTLRWRVSVNHQRRGGGYDAWLGDDFGLFRAEDAIPRAASRTLKGAASNTSLQLRLPRGWSAVTEYAEYGGRYPVATPGRRFDQPSGWIVAGRLGVRREQIAGVRIAVAGPVGHSLRRLDMLALLHWTLPELGKVVPALPERITIVSAGDPMWRGGLSAPQSFYLHADRPLISENATSTLLHEVLHLALGFGTAHGYDWIVEGLAEYYSLEMLYRSGTISRDRYLKAHADLEAWSRDADSLCRPVSSGPVTALAVTVFAALDRETRKRTDRRAGLDEIVRALWEEDGPVDLHTLRRVAGRIAGREPAALALDNLPGCRNIASAGPKP